MTGNPQSDTCRPTLGQALIDLRMRLPGQHEHMARDIDKVLDGEALLGDRHNALLRVVSRSKTFDPETGDALSQAFRRATGDRPNPDYNMNLVLHAEVGSRTRQEAEPRTEPRRSDRGGKGW